MLHTGELLLAREHQKKTLALYDRELDQPLAFLMGTDVKQQISSYAGWTLWFLGYPDQAGESGEEAATAAEAMTHPNSLAAAQFFANIVRIYRREARAVQESARHNLPRGDLGKIALG
jgi:hypothetical protein